jgi:hypothetical protein
LIYRALPFPLLYLPCSFPLRKVFFAGGFSDAGATSQAEVWRFPLARRGEPKLDIGQKGRDLGGVGCGGMVGDAPFHPIFLDSPHTVLVCFFEGPLPSALV